MIDVTLTFNGYDLHNLLSTYEVTHAVETVASETAIDGTEYVVAKRRPIVTFSLIPLTDAQCRAVYNALYVLTAETTYTDPNLGDRTVTMRVASDLEKVFALSSVDGNRYYKGSKIVLRRRTAI